MGMYDTIEFECPDCGTEMFAQSKSGGCILANYQKEAVNIQVAYDANRHAPFECHSCFKKWRFTNVPEILTPKTVSLEVEEYKE